MAATKKQIDREGLEREYRIGVKTFRAMSAEFGLSASRIKQIADEEGWTRDLSAKINAAAESKLNNATLNAKLNKEQQAERKASEKEVVEANAQAVADVLLSHRDDIRRHRAVATGLLVELESQVADPDLFEQLGELMASPDGRGTDKLNDMYRKVIALPGKVDASRKLAETLKVLIALEREAFNVQPGGEDPLKKLGEQFAKTASESWKLAINALD